MREGEMGFVKQSHLDEHLRGYHEISHRRLDPELPIQQRSSSDADLPPKLDLPVQGFTPLYARQAELMRSDLLHDRGGNWAQDSVEAAQAPPEMAHISDRKWQKGCQIDQVLG
jgi:hypothetical protein